MSNSHKRAFGSSAKSKRKDVNLDLATARQMLPLVESIVRDIIHSKQKLDRLAPEQDNLDRHRHDLVWQERERRYHVHEEISATERTLKAAVQELKELGLALLDEKAGRIGFPTRINGRPAVFSWEMGEDGVQFWNYEEENLRRPIPSDWVSGTPLRLRG